MKKLLLVNVILNIITISMIIFNLNLPDIYINAFKTLAFVIYVGTIAMALKKLNKTSSTVLMYTHFNPEVCRKCGYKLCICHLYPPPPEKPKNTDLLTMTIFEQDYKN